MRPWASPCARGGVSRAVRWRSPLLRPRRCYGTPGKVKVYAKTSDGTEVDFEAPVGVSLMVALRDYGELFVQHCCSGVMRCTTCHVYVDPAWYDRAGGTPCEEEQDMLDEALEPRAVSRLACQVKLTPELDGIAVALPQSTVNLMFGDADPTGLGRGPSGK